MDNLIDRLRELQAHTYNANAARILDAAVAEIERLQTQLAQATRLAAAKETETAQAWEQAGSDRAELNIALLEIDRLIEELNTPALREALAEYAHQAWAGWMQYLFTKGLLDSDESYRLPAWAVERWTRQMETLYVFLPEEEKASDRAEADKMLALVRRALAAREVGG